MNIFKTLFISIILFSFGSTQTAITGGPYDYSVEHDTDPFTYSVDVELSGSCIGCTGDYTCVWSAGNRNDNPGCDVTVTLFGMTDGNDAIYEFSLEIFNTSNESQASASTTVTITPELNDPPTVVLDEEAFEDLDNDGNSPDFEVASYTGNYGHDAADVVLDACSSYDEGDPLTFEWTLVDGEFPSDCTLDACTFSCANGIGYGIYKVSLTVTDSYDAATTMDVFQFEVLALNDAPTLDATSVVSDSDEIAHDCDVDNNEAGATIEATFEDKDGDDIHYAFVPAGTNPEDAAANNSIPSCFGWAIPVYNTADDTYYADVTCSMSLENTTTFDIYVEDYLDRADLLLADNEFSVSATGTTEIVTMTTETNNPPQIADIEDITQEGTRNCQDFTTVTATAVAYEEDGDALDFTWTYVGGGMLADGTEFDCSGTTCEMSLSNGGTHTVMVTVEDCYYDINQNSTASTSFNVDLAWANTAPVVDAGDAQYLEFGCDEDEVSFTLQATASDLENDAIESVEWKDSDGNIVSTALTYSGTTSSTTATYSFTATDCYNETSGASDVTVNVATYQTQPIVIDLPVNPIENQVEHDNSDGLGGTAIVEIGSDLEEQEGVSYFWTQSLGTLCNIAHPMVLTTSVTCTGSDNSRVFHLEASNDCGDTGAGDVAVFVYPEENHDPVAVEQDDYDVSSANNCNVDLEATFNVCANVTDDDSWTGPFPGMGYSDELEYTWTVDGVAHDETDDCITVTQETGIAIYGYTVSDGYGGVDGADGFAVTLVEDSSDPEVSHTLLEVDGDPYMDGSIAVEHDGDIADSGVTLGLSFSAVDSDGCENTEDFFSYTFSEDTNADPEYETLIELCGEDTYECLFENNPGYQTSTLIHDDAEYQYMLEVCNIYDDCTDYPMSFMVEEESNNDPNAVMVARDEYNQVVSSLQVERDPIDGFEGVVVFTLDGSDSDAGDGEDEDEATIEYAWEIKAEWTQENIEPFDNDTTYAENDFDCNLADSATEQAVMTCNHPVESNGNCINIWVCLGVEDDYYDLNTESDDGSDEICQVLKVYPEANAAPVANTNGPYSESLEHDGDPDAGSITVDLDGSGSSDSDDNPPDSYDNLTYAWTGIGVEACGDTEQCVTAELGEGIHNFTLTVTDLYFVTDDKDFTVVIFPENNSGPIAGYDPENTWISSVHDGDPDLVPVYHLDADGSIDPDTENDSEIECYTWWDGYVKLTEEPCGDKLQIFEGDAIEDTDGSESVTLTLVVKDFYDEEGSMDVTFSIVEENEAPEVTDEDVASNLGGHDLVPVGPGGDITCDNCVTDDDTYTDGNGNAAIDLLECLWIDADGMVVSNDCNTISGVGVDEDGMSLDSESFTLRVEDPYGAVDNKLVNFIYTETNLAPNAPTANNTTATIASDGLLGGQATVTMAAASTDDDGDDVTHCWYGGDLDDRSIDCTDGDVLTVTLSEGVYEYSVVSVDPYGAESDHTVVTVTVFAEDNNDPIASLEASSPDDNDTFKATHGGDPETDTATFLLDASASDDGDPIPYTDDFGDDMDEILSFSYSQVSGPDVTITADADGDSAWVTGALAGVYEFNVTVTDGYGASSLLASSGTITVSGAENDIPVADVLPGDETDMDVDVPHDGDETSGWVTINLDASESDNDENNAEGDELEYEWKIVDEVICETAVCSYDYNAGSFADYNGDGIGVCPGGSISVSLTVTDSYDLPSVPVSLLVNVECEENHDPEVDAGGGPSGTQYAEITHDGDPDTNLQQYCLTYLVEDDDGDELFCEWSQTSGPSLGEVVGACNALAAGTYDFQLSCTDDYGAAVTDQAIVVMAAEANADPVADAGDNINALILDDCVTDNNFAPVTLNGSESSDEDGDDLTYSWSDGNNEICETANCNLMLDTIGSPYTYTLTVTDSYGGNGSSDVVVVTVSEDVAQLPVADAGPDQIVYASYNCDEEEGDVIITLDGSDSYDPAGCGLTYEWTDEDENIICSDMVCNTTIDASEVFILEVENGNEESSTQTVEITWNAEAADFAPEAVASNPVDTAIECDGDAETNTASVVLKGCNSSDPNGACSLDYEWLFDNVTYQGCEVTVQAEEGHNQEAILTITNYLYDDEENPVNPLNSSSTTVTFSVDEEECNAPVANAGNEQTHTIEADCIADGQAEDISVSGSCLWFGASASGTSTWSSCIGDALVLTEENYMDDGSLLFDADAGNYCLELTCTDDMGEEGNDQITITVIEENDADPVADAGPGGIQLLPIEHDDAYGGEEEITLDASGSSDECDGLSYVWYDNDGILLDCTANDDPALCDQLILVSQDDDINEPICFTLVVEDFYGNESASDETCYRLREDNAPPTAVIEISNESNVLTSGVNCASPFENNHDVLFTSANSYDADDASDGWTHEWSDGSTSITMTDSFEYGENEVSVNLYGNYYGNPSYESDMGTGTLQFNVEYDLAAPFADAGYNEIIEIGTDCNVYDEVLFVLDAGSSSAEECNLTYLWQDRDENTICTDVTCNYMMSVDAGEEDVTLTVTDFLGQTDTDTKTLTVISSNELPLATLAVDNDDIPENITFINDGSQSIDTEGCELSYEWRDENGTLLSNEVAFVVEGGIEALTNAGVVKHYTLTVSDPFGAVHSVTKTVNIQNVNIDPLAEICSGPASFEIIHDGDPLTDTAPVQLDGSCSSDNDLDELIYTWTSVVGEEPTVIATGVTAEIGLTAGSHDITLNLDDQYGGSAEYMRAYSVGEEPNSPPLAVFQEDISYEFVPELAQISLQMNGCTSSDPDNDPIVFNWNVDGLTDDCTECLCNTFIPVPAEVTDISITLQVIDSYGDSDSVTETIAMDYNVPPIAQFYHPSALMLEDRFEVDGSLSYDLNAESGDYISTCTVEQKLQFGCTAIGADIIDLGECRFEISAPSLSELQSNVILPQDYVLCLSGIVEDSFGEQSILEMELQLETGSYVIQLDDGANFVSFPVLPYDNASQSVLENYFDSGLWVDSDNMGENTILDGLLDDFIYMISQGIGLFNTDQGWSGNLNDIDFNSGYFLGFDNQQLYDAGSNVRIEFEIDGLVQSPGMVYDLVSGNNLISYHGETMYWQDAISEDMQENINYIIGMGTGIFRTDNGWSGNLSNMSKGNAYWMNINIPPGQWIEFSYQQSSMARIAEADMDIALEFKPVQSMKQSFYIVENITINGSDPELGDIVLAYRDNVLAGSAYWNELETTIPVMGYDDSRLTSDYLRDGETPELFLYSKSSGVISELSGNVGPWHDLNASFVDELNGSTVQIPESYKLAPAYPNPFNPVTTISYSLPKDTDISLAVYSILGEQVDMLEYGLKVAGTYNVTWNAGNLSSGVYFIRMESAEFSDVQKIMLMK